MDRQRAECVEALFLSHRGNWLRLDLRRGDINVLPIKGM
jgi:hypothetical protein